MDTTPPSTAPTTTPSKQIVQLTKPKPKTAFRELLLAFSFFDSQRTNHVNIRDLEDLFLAIGLSLSRSKVRALISKLTVGKDGLLNYRSLTDKTPKELQAETEFNNVNFKLPEDNEIAASVIPYQAEGGRLATASSFNKDTGVIELNGTTVDVINTLKNLDHSQNLVGKLEAKLREAIDEMGKLAVGQLATIPTRIKTSI